MVLAALTLATTAVPAPAKHGGVPMLLDVDPDTLNVSPASVEAAIEDGMRVLVAVHYGGVAVDLLPDGYRAVFMLRAAHLEAALYNASGVAGDSGCSLAYFS